MLRLNIMTVFIILTGCTFNERTLKAEDKFRLSPDMKGCFDSGGDEYRLRPTDKEGGECVWRKKK